MIFTDRSGEYPRQECLGSGADIGDSLDRGRVPAGEGHTDPRFGDRARREAWGAVHL